MNVERFTKLLVVNSTPSQGEENRHQRFTSHKRTWGGLILARWEEGRGRGATTHEVFVPLSKIPQLITALTEFYEAAMKEQIELERRDAKIRLDAAELRRQREVAS